MIPSEILIAAELIVYAAAAVFVLIEAASILKPRKGNQ